MAATAILAVLIAALALPESLPANHFPPPAESNILAARTAAYFNPDRPGEGVFVEILPGGRALLYLFSYGPKFEWGSQPDVIREHEQTWMIAVGWVTEDGIHAEGVRPVGGHFGAAFDPNEIEYQDFGLFLLDFPTCGSNTEAGSFLVWAVGPDTFDFQDLELDNYVQLSSVLDCVTSARSQYAHLSGSWFDPGRAGEGFILQVLHDGRALVQWMTFDNAGHQMWLQGLGAFDESGLVLSVAEMQIFKGTYWGSDFVAADITVTPFGSLTITFWNCAMATLDYHSPQFGSGSQNLARLTTPIRINDAGIGCWDY